ncbi:MAG: NAD+ synthase [Bdellovibrionales bacterium]|nr:NAD+ synthase [Bdellovibrionales bacterium]
MRVALAQINACLGRFEQNAERIISATLKAQQQDVDLVVFPECALMGYHPVDLLERVSIVREQIKYVNWIHKRLPKGLPILVGLITFNENTEGKPFRNSVVLLEKHKEPKYFHKELLPNYDVFDEGRHIEPGKISANRFTLKGKRVLVTICEDIWGWERPKSKGRTSLYEENPLEKIKPKSIDLVVNLSASPFSEKKLGLRKYVCSRVVQHFKVPLVYVNMVGGQDELVFDGGSLALNEKGKFIVQCQRFQEDLQIFDTETQKPSLAIRKRKVHEDIRQALVLGLRDFVQKTGFKKVHLGLSGGIDSAVVACLSVEALGAENVKCIALPTQYNSQKSLKLAQQLCKNLKIEMLEIPIDSLYGEALKTFQQAVPHKEFNLVNENLQSRLRGLMLMAYSNKFHSMLLTTSNKTELAMGYSTLYGDMTGGLLVIGDLLKREVYDLAKIYNSKKEIIPKEILTREPSAELRPNQKDSDSLPSYPILDVAVEHLVEGYRTPKSEVDHTLLKSMMRSEFKRWQAPPILRVSEHAFGRGRRFPIAHGAIY